MHHQLPSPPAPAAEEAAAAAEAMEVEGAAAAAAAAAKGKGSKPPLFLPETTVYLTTLAVSSALRLGRLDLATELATALVGGWVGAV